MAETELLRLVYLLGFLILVLPAAIALNRSRRVRWRNILVWVAIGAALILLYPWVAPRLP